MKVRETNAIARHEENEYTFISGKRYEPDDAKTIAFADEANDDFQNMQRMFLFDIMPWMRKMLPTVIFNKITGGGTVLGHRKQFFTLAQVSFYCRQTI